MYNCYFFGNNIAMKRYILGLICGLLNGIFGSGGGVAAVPLLESTGLEARKSHATSVALIFILSLISTTVYLLNDNIDFNAAMQYVPYGAIGAIVGAILLKKVPNSVLRRIFGAVIVAAAVRIILQ